MKQRQCVGANGAIACLVSRQPRLSDDPEPNENLMVDPASILNIAAKVSGWVPLIAFVAALFFLVTYRVLGLNIFANVGSDGTVTIVRDILWYFFIVSCLALVVGSSLYVLASFYPPQSYASPWSDLRDELRDVVSYYDSREKQGESKMRKVRDDALHISEMGEARRASASSEAEAVDLCGIQGAAQAIAVRLSFEYPTDKGVASIRANSERAQQVISECIKRAATLEGQGGVYATWIRQNNVIECLMWWAAIAATTRDEVEPEPTPCSAVSWLSRMSASFRDEFPPERDPALSKVAGRCPSSDTKGKGGEV